MKETKRKIFASIFRWFILGIFLVIITFSFFLYTQFENIVLALIYASFKDNLNQTKASVEYVLDSAKVVSLQIFNNESLQKLFYYPELDSVSSFQALRQLNNYRQANNTLIHSIYIYNKRIDTFYVSSGFSTDFKYSSKYFPDKEIIDLFKESYLNNEYQMIARDISIDTIKGMNIKVRVLTYIFKKLSTLSMPEAAVAINVSSSWIQAILDILGKNQSNSVFIIDKNASIVISDKILVSKIENSRLIFVENILEKNSEEGYLISQFDDIKSLISYLYIPSLNWYLVQITPYQDIVSRISILRFRTFLGSIVFLILGLLVSFIISNRVYKPIAPIIKRSNDLEQEKEKNTKALGFTYLVRYVREEVSMEENGLVENMAMFGLPIADSYSIIAMLLRFDNYVKYKLLYNKAERIALKNEGLDNLNKILEKEIGGFSIDVGDDQYFIVVPIGKNKIVVHTLILDLLAEFKKAMQFINVDSFTSVYIGPLESMEDLYGIQTKLYNISNNRWISGYGNVFNANDTAEHIECNDISSHELEETEKGFKNAIALLHDQKAIEMINSIEKCYSKLNYLSARSRISTLAYNIISEIILPLYQSRNMDCPDDISNFPLKINDAETLSIISIELRQLILKVVNQIQDKNSNKINELIAKTIEFIEINYNNTNLCLAMISDAIGISTEYLGRIVKRKTGKSVADHINDIRLIKSYDLLLTTNITIKELTSRVGISNDQYFYTLFKKKYGMTPKELRYNKS